MTILLIDFMICTLCIMGLDVLFNFNKIKNAQMFVPRRKNWMYTKIKSQWNLWTDYLCSPCIFDYRLNALKDVRRSVDHRLRVKAIWKYFYLFTRQMFIAQRHNYSYYIIWSTEIQQIKTFQNLTDAHKYELSM